MKFVIVLFIAGVATLCGAQTWIESTFASFQFPFGSGMLNGLTIDSAGNLYTIGPSQTEGANEVVYKVSPSGVVTVFYSFTNAVGFSSSQLSQDSAGNLYGASGKVLFRLSPKGRETTLYTFKSPNGSSSPVRLDAARNLYGYYFNGTSNAIFKLTPAGKFSTLHTFLAGNFPNQSLIIDSKGNLFGTALGGTFGQGFVFKLTPTLKYSVLHNFTGGSDGAGPTGKLTQNKSGTLYGTTLNGGNLAPEQCISSSTGLPDGCGTIFSVTSASSFSTFYTFSGDFETDGWQPFGALTLDTLGNIYGITLSGDNSSYPLVSQFQISSLGIATKIARVGSDTENVDGLVFDKAGNLYGLSNSVRCCENSAIIYKLTKN